MKEEGQAPLLTGSVDWSFAWSLEAHHRNWKTTSSTAHQMLRERHFDRNMMLLQPGNHVRIIIVNKSVWWLNAITLPVQHFCESIRDSRKKEKYQVYIVLPAEYPQDTALLRLVWCLWTMPARYTFVTMIIFCVCYAEEPFCLRLRTCSATGSIAFSHRAFPSARSSTRSG